jgi:hypothetical protein
MAMATVMLADSGLAVAGCIRGAISAAISGQLQFRREPGVTAYHSNLYRTS